VLKLGESVKLAHMEQSRDSLKAGEAVWQSIADGEDTFRLGPTPINVRAYIARFGFTGQISSRRWERCRGGQRNRLHLARMLKSGANVILLDEPTNDLDVNTIREALEEGMENFAGCAGGDQSRSVVLDRVATHILAFEGDSQVGVA